MCQFHLSRCSTTVFIINGPYSFPGQECAAGDSKIPSIMYYNQDGSVHSAGAEATAPGIELDAEDNELILVEWFVEHGISLFVAWADGLPGSSYTSVRRGSIRGKSNCEPFLLFHQGRPWFLFSLTSSHTSFRAPNATFVRPTRPATASGRPSKTGSNLFFLTPMVGRDYSKARCVKLRPWRASCLVLRQGTLTCTS